MITETETSTQAKPVAREGTALSEAPAVEQELRAEHTLVIDSIRDVALTVPVTIALMVGIVVLAVRHQDPDWGAWLPMAVGIGAWAGLFFGLWIAFVRNAERLQKIDTSATSRRVDLSDENGTPRAHGHSGRAA